MDLSLSCLHDSHADGIYYKGSLLLDLLVNSVNTLPSLSFHEFRHVQYGHYVDPHVLRGVVHVDLDYFILSKLGRLSVLFEQDLYFWIAELEHGVFNICRIYLRYFKQLFVSDLVPIVEKTQNGGLEEVCQQNIFFLHAVCSHLQVSVRKKPVDLSRRELLGVELLKNHFNAR